MLKVLGRKRKIEDDRVFELIEAVKIRQCIWNPAHPAYKHRLIAAKAWKEIATELDAQEEVVKARWKNLKDTLIKKVKEAQGMNLDECPVQWKYFEPLNFLVVAKNETHENTRKTKIAEENNDNDDRNDNNTSDSDDFDRNDEQSSIGAFPVHFTPIPIKNDDDDVQDDDPESAVEENKLEEPSPPKRSRLNEDYDIMFLKSLAPYFWELETTRKLTVIRKITEILMEELSKQSSERSKRSK